MVFNHFVGFDKMVKITLENFAKNLHFYIEISKII